jgi:RNAse (barnase) inhibitor barstar
MEPATQIIIDGREARAPADIYRLIRAAEGMPAALAEDVDALWVLFTEQITRPVDLTWIHADQSRAALGVQFMMMMAVLQEADGHTSRRPDRPRFRLALGGPNN